MIGSRRYLGLTCLLGLLGLLGLPGLSAPVVKQIGPGVVLSQEVDTNPVCPLIINCVSVDLGDPRVEIKTAVGKDVVIANDPAKGRETISAMTARRGALVGVNADFFPFTGDPLGICIIDGELVSEPPGNRAAVAVTRDRTVFFDTPRLDASLVTANGASRRIDGINRIRETNQIVLYTPIFGASTGNRFKSVDLVCTSSDLPIRVNTPIKLTVTEIRPDATDTPIPGDGVIISGGGEAAAFLAENIKLGDTITVRFDVKSPNDLDWTNVAQAVGGGPWLLRQGKPWIDTVAEGFSVSGFEKARHPRTAIGLTRDNKLLLVTVDGRQTISAGISLPDLAALMKRLGAVTAINLDGGGSTTLSVRGILVNAPSGGIEREIASALLVFVPEQAEEEQPLPTITGLPPEIVSGQGMMLQLAWPDRSTSLSVEELEVSATHIKPGVARDSTAPNRPGESLETRLSQEPEALRNVVWGTTGGVGFVNQSGYFTPVKARKGTVNAIYGSRIVSADVKVTPGPPAKLSAELQPDKTDPLRAMIVVTALDMNGNPVSAKEILLNVTGGKPDLERGTTDDKGSFSTGITWDQSALNRAAVATLGDLKAEAGQK